jgi:hypothetical protein
MNTPHSTLLRDIQSSALSVDTSVEVLLRQCVVLAARLNHNPLREWANLELTGYPGDVPLPPYRPKINTTVLGNLAGYFQSQLRNAGLAASAVPDDELRDALFTFEVRMGVPEMEALLESGGQTFTYPWPTDVVVLLQGAFYDDMNLMQAWKVLPATIFRSTLSGIRDRVLQFALDIEAENPEAGEAAPGEIPIPQEQVSQIFNQHFYGSIGAVATAGRDVAGVQGTVNMTALTAALDSLGIEKVASDALVEAVRADQAENGAVGSRTREWLDRLSTGAIGLGSGVSAGVATDLIAKLLGIG